MTGNTALEAPSPITTEAGAFSAFVLELVSVTTKEPGEGPFRFAVKSAVFVPKTVAVFGNTEISTTGTTSMVVLTELASQVAVTVTSVATATESVLKIKGLGAAAIGNVNGRRNRCDFHSSACSCLQPNAVRLAG